MVHLASGHLGRADRPLRLGSFFKLPSLLSHALADSIPLERTFLALEPFQRPVWPVKAL